MIVPAHTARRVGSAPPTRASERSVSLRFGSFADERQLARLAELDSSEPLPQPILLAEVDGRLLAALATSTGAVIADPYHRTADLIELLHARARQLAAASETTRVRRLSAWARVPARYIRSLRL